MNANTKAILLSIVCFFFLFLGTHTLLKIYFNINNTIVLGVVSAIVASIFSPRRIIVKKQTGKQVILKWLFTKKVIVIN